ncbi:MAG: CCA tRNA nucleotidyltransferase [Nitrospira sp. SB0666_bin_27]|nr:CCA tRNA nucleotidyltransferase [Nitrospira sp. SB0666_bin_27]MYF23981.1 CCA tRNA nucleotidyltransferase [Nitrospira sp. SB0678_bin_10]
MDSVYSYIKDRVPTPFFSLLQQAGELAEGRHVRVYVVGGFVRDLLLGIPNLDLDMVVEGDGIRFAKALAQRYQARVTTHDRFGTATITLADGQTLDVATARTESYDSPAALPTVRRSSIKEDLRRRDFTINTLAIRLNADNPGELVDLHGGLRDLQNKTIRVLHGLSFIDDPTRVFRAIRLEQRLGFQLDKDTAVLMTEAVKMELLHRLSPSRLSVELHHVLSEREPVKTLARLAGYNVLQFIHPRLKWSPELARLMKVVEKAVEWHAGVSLGPLASPWVVYGMALLDALPQPAIQETLARLTFPRRQTQSLLRTSRENTHLLLTLDRTVKPSETFRALCNFPEETLMFLMAKTRSKRTKQKIVDMLTAYRRMKPILNGTDLKTMGFKPGPLYNRILERLLDARLDGTVETETDERRLVQQLAKQG